MKNLKERGEKVLSPVLGKYFSNFEIEKGKGCYLFSTAGRKYLDFSSGIAVAATGYSHPKVVKAAKKQLEKLIHICIGVAYYEPYVVLAERLSEIVPIKNAQFFFCQSGSEAVEAAIKLAKYVTHKPGLVAIKGGFHGRSFGALSLTTSKMKYRDGYGPFLPKVYIAEPSLASISKILKTKKIAGLILEPILGEGGYLVFPKKFIKGVRKLCTKHKVLMIMDEIQTGIGRTGKWFASEYSGVKPDILCMAKGIASGFPLGAICAPSKIMGKWSPGAHGGTFGGNPVCCAAAIATLDTIKKEKLLKNTKKMGIYLKKKLLALKAKYPIIKEVRGLGLMLGVDFKDSAVVKKILNYCLDNKLVLISTGADGTVIRFVPPLIVKKKEIDQGLRVFTKALKSVS
ncbi:MAG: aminotransferase class III-fold pyridoxal phosphate-dependent enzyme [Candidatus Saganbacteria bacterium]|nr:aminotransferase class III-fold pyridoxal phosphate-dependent enzyme [Candidatus Saganbacteria bacterium]